MANKKRNTQEFINEMQIINSNVEILGEFKTTETKIKCKCKIDNYIWYPIPKTLLRGHGCPKCAGMLITHEEFIDRLNKINPNIEINGIYNGTECKLECHCNIDGYEWNATPHDLLRGRGCAVCGGKILLPEMAINNIKENNPNIEVIGEFNNTKTKIRVRCKKHDIVWDAQYNNLIKGSGCYICRREKSRISKEDYFNRLNENKRNEYTIIEYIKYSSPIIIKHNLCGYEFTTSAFNFEHGLGCPLCYGTSTKSTERFIKEVKDVWGDEYEVIGKYIDDKTKIKVKHNCGYEYKVRPSSLLNGNGCIKCKESKGEKEVARCLDSFNIEYIIQYKFDDCKYKKCLPFDFYLPKHNILIEYQGEHHYMPINGRGGNKKFKDNQIRDNIKREYCINHNIELIEIPYWCYDDIEDIICNRFYYNKKITNL